jgi:HSP20 family protein
MPRAKQTAERGVVRAIVGGVLLEADRLIDRFAVGTWNPNVDLCETRDLVVVRVELPGVDPSDVRVTFHNGALRLQGIKRETTVSPRLLCYYCLERTYGRFDREIAIHRVIDAPRARGVLENGILTIELPKLRERRGTRLEIPIEKR